MKLRASLNICHYQSSSSAEYFMIVGLPHRYHCPMPTGFYIYAPRLWDRENFLIKLILLYFKFIKKLIGLKIDSLL